MVTVMSAVARRAVVHAGHAVFAVIHFVAHAVFATINCGGAVNVMFAAIHCGAAAHARPVATQRGFRVLAASHRSGSDHLTLAAIHVRGFCNALFLAIWVVSKSKRMIPVAYVTLDKCVFLTGSKN